MFSNTAGGGGGGSSLIAEICKAGRESATLEVAVRESHTSTLLDGVAPPTAAEGRGSKSQQVDGRMDFKRVNQLTHSALSVQ